jgi:vancomycin permeability regulator SanA
VFSAVTRGIALFLGLFTFANVVGDLPFARANTNLWWLDLWPLTIPVARILLLAIAAALLSYSLWPNGGRGRRRASQAVLLLASCFAAVSAVRFYIALANHEIHTTFPVPLSSIVALLLVAIVVAHEQEHHNQPLAVFANCMIAAAVFPLIQVCFFGVTDYRRPAEAIVVFGARAKADGSPSDALADRVRTGCDLYRAGMAPLIIMSGGPGEGRTTEPQVMRAFAQTLGVPAAAIVEDAGGVNTEATVRNTARLLRSPARILVVSHFYHLPRIKITYQHYGIEAFTVPSRNSVPLSMPFNIARESAAFWWYYARHFA